jgi:TATA-binding protein-associated factor
LDVLPGVWVWEGVLRVLEVDLFSAAWEVRHGAAMALRELLKIQGKYGGMKGTLLRALFFSALTCHSGGLTQEENDHLHEKWCNDLAAQLLCVFVLDRFGDFVSDQASVRTLHRPDFHLMLLMFRL